MAQVTVLVEEAEGIAQVMLNRPEARNALDLTMREELENGLRVLAAEPRVRVLVVRGAGDHFCAGGDVKFMQARRMIHWEGLVQGMMIESEDHREGLAAFFEKRRPRFTGR